MDLGNISFDWNRARAFLVTAEEGSFSAAARALGMAQPTLGRQVRALEDELGVALFERVGRGLVPTPVGLEVLEHVRAMGQGARRVAMVAEGRSLSLDGVVSVAASEVYAVFVLPALLTRIRGLYPGIEFDVVASNSPSDLLRREADIALRHFQPTEPDLMIRKLGHRAARLYATPAYLASLGDPTTPEGFSEASFMAFDRSDALRQRLGALGLPLSPGNFPIASANQLVQWEMARRGAGICLMMEEVGDADPQMRRVLPDLAPIMVPMVLTSHRELQTSRRIRVVFDLLAEALAPPPAT